jgi:hypothetical protein
MVCCCLLALSSFAREAQVGALRVGTLHIFVTDVQQHALPGAECELLSATSNDASARPQVLSSTKTDEQGIAVFTNLPPGSYLLRVSSKGFETLTREGVRIVEGQTSEVGVSLNIEAVTGSVTVNAPDNAATSIEAGASTPSGSLEGRAVQRLPLATARIDEALPLVPGVVRSSTGEISIKGATEQQSALRVNGLNAADPASGNFRLNLPVDSVESVQVFLHPYTAEFGQFTGGVTDVATRRGGEHWHFELNDFLPDLRIKGGSVVGIAEDAPHLNFNGPLVKNRFYVSQSLA